MAAVSRWCMQLQLSHGQQQLGVPSSGRADAATLVMYVAAAADAVNTYCADCGVLSEPAC
jgi:hypothetical protein